MTKELIDKVLDKLMEGVDDQVDAAVAELNRGGLDKRQALEYVAKTLLDNAAVQGSNSGWGDFEFSSAADEAWSVLEEAKESP